MNLGCTPCARESCASRRLVQTCCRRFHRVTKTYPIAFPCHPYQEARSLGFGIPRHGKWWHCNMNHHQTVAVSTNSPYSCPNNKPRRTGVSEKCHWIPVPRRNQQLNAPSKNKPSRYPEVADVIVSDYKRLGQKTGKVRYQLYCWSDYARVILGIHTHILSLYHF